MSAQVPFSRTKSRATSSECKGRGPTVRLLTEKSRRLRALGYDEHLVSFKKGACVYALLGRTRERQESIPKPDSKDRGVVTLIEPSHINAPEPLVSLYGFAK